MILTSIAAALLAAVTGMTTIRARCSTMAVQRSPKPLMRVRFLSPLPKEHITVLK